MQLNTFIHLLKEKGVETTVEPHALQFYSASDSLKVNIISDSTYVSTDSGISLSKDYIVRFPEKMVAIVCSKLGLNKTIFARKCETKNITKITAEQFLNQYHLFGSTQSAYNYGLFSKDELIAVASFSKGRKMNRLEAHERSFELIRFCSKNGINVSGGLSKLVKHFMNEKKAGDVMTYVDKQLSDGKSFIKAGFKKHSETEATYFLVNRITYERKVLKNREEIFDTSKYYLTQNGGNIKLIYSAKI